MAIFYLLSTDYTGLGIVLTAFGGVITAVLGGCAVLISSRNGAKLANVKTAQEAAAVKVDQTHELVNGNLLIVRRQLWTAVGCIAALVGFILWDSRKN